MTILLPRLADDPHAPFPPVHEALTEPDGLLAFGGDLQPARLLNAYRHGIFPWYSRGEPILWWSPDPRCVFDTATFHLPRRMRRDLRHRGWILRADTAFASVIRACASVPRRGQRGTWITDEMQAAYIELHRLGHAHSIEVFDGERLVGGIYGVASGAVFCGESMFSAESGGSRVALAALCTRLAANGVALLDAQVPNPHLDLLGARRMHRDHYIEWLGRGVPGTLPVGSWAGLAGVHHARELA